jgi:polysaccharide export outer membrane protein
VCSCVPNRKYVYLQKDDLNKPVLKDSVVRSYKLHLTDYRIQPQDLLSIRFESLTPEEFDFMEELNAGSQGGSNVNSMFINGYLVDNNGMVEFPVIGKITLLNLTLFEAQEKLQEVFAPYLKNPVVRVRLLNFRFTILGEVNGESQVVSQNVRVNIMEAIGMAGGFTELADRSRVKIVRQRGNNSEIIYLDLLDENLIMSNNYYLHQNDLIVVPALRQRPFRRYFGTNIALAASTVSSLLLLYTIIDSNNDN